MAEVPGEGHRDGTGKEIKVYGALKAGWVVSTGAELSCQPGKGMLLRVPEAPGICFGGWRSSCVRSELGVA